LLEAVRISGKLNPLFLEGGMLHRYFVELNPALPQKWPRENELPSKVTKDTTSIRQWLKAKNIAWDVGKTRLVYGPQWQRMIMFYLLTKSWVLPNDAHSGGSRPERLQRLLQLLQVQGIDFGKEWNAYGFNVETSLNNLKNNQLLIVDKGGHAMFGVVKTKQRKMICVYNQQRPEDNTEKSTDFWPRGVGKSSALKNKDGTVLNYYLPVNIVQIQQRGNGVISRL